MAIKPCPRKLHACYCAELRHFNSLSHKDRWVLFDSHCSRFVCAETDGEVFRRWNLINNAFSIKCPAQHVIRIHSAECGVFSVTLPIPSQTIDIISAESGFIVYSKQIKAGKQCELQEETCTSSINHLKNMCNKKPVCDKPIWSGFHDAECTGQPMPKTSKLLKVKWNAIFFAYSCINGKWETQLVF